MPSKYKSYRVVTLVYTKYRTLKYFSSSTGLSFSTLILYLYYFDDDDNDDALVIVHQLTLATELNCCRLFLKQVKVVIIETFTVKHLLLHA